MARHVRRNHVYFFEYYMQMLLYGLIIEIPVLGGRNMYDRKFDLLVINDVQREHQGHGAHPGPDIIHLPEPDFIIYATVPLHHVYSIFHLAVPIADQFISSLDHRFRKNYMPPE